MTRFLPGLASAPGVEWRRGRAVAGEPVLGAMVLDRLGRVWAHVEHGFDGTEFYGWWHMAGSDEPESWARVQEYAPLYLVG